MVNRNADDRRSRTKNEKIDAADDHGHQPPPGDEEVRDRHHEQRRRRQVRAEAREHLLERRDHPHHDHPDDDDGDDDDRDRVEQRRLDLALDREDLFLVRREPVEDRVEHAGGLAGAAPDCSTASRTDGVLAERLRQARAGFDAALDVEHQPREARVAVAAGDDVERLQQRHARPQHGRELAREEGDVALADPAPAAEGLPLDLGDADALPPQVGRDDGLGRGARLAADLAVVAVEAFPDEREFLDVPCAARLLWPWLTLFRPSLVGDGFDFLERGHALLDLEEARVAQIADAFLLRLLGDVERGAVAHDELAHVVGDRHHLVDADAALVARALAVLAPDRAERLPRAVEVLFGEPGAAAAPRAGCPWASCSACTACGRAAGP